MKWFAITWIVVGSILVAVAAFFLITQGFGPTTTTLIATMGLHWPAIRRLWYLGPLRRAEALSLRAQEPRPIGAGGWMNLPMVGS